ncbi:Piezo-type mechanosensitive ion channel component 2 [Trichinella pseudospiralis]|uniref:Piezo-type mechanosensitive ion channel component 2 n=1 Tax=Trichinella pseudospiralis TaxID=6337 RepID=A0A0V1FXK5_TRIPS|nr:Piezo-type mechanosensitive ion channel component 2 [Trichinella pseudospiralis]
MFSFVAFYFFIFPITLFIESTICYLKIASSLPLLFAVLQTCFHVTLNLSSSMNEWLVTCEGWEPELRMIGFERLDNLSLFNKIRIFLPEIIVFVAAVTTLVLAKLSLRRQRSEEDDIIPLHLTGGNENNAGTTFRRHADSGTACTSLLGIELFNIESFPRLIVILAFWIAAVAHPCLFTSIYFLVLLLSLVIWAFDISLDNSCFKHVNHIILFYVAFNLSALYLYQFWPIQKQLPPEDLPARLIGMKAYINSSCNPGEIWTGEKLLSEISAEVWLYPISLFILYFSIAYLDLASSKLRFNSGKLSRHTSMESLISDSPSAKDDSGPFINLNWDNEHEPTTADANIANADTATRLLCPSRWYRFYRKILPLLLRNFFTVSLVVMMAWAVIYHSWLSFVWLVMACGIWIYHDSRKAYMLLSPLIISYSQVLLVLQFIYGLNLTNDELPEEVAAVSLKQIGLSKDSDHPAEPLTVKLLLTFFCYITIRLLMKENKMKNFGVDTNSLHSGDNDNVTSKTNMKIHITRLLPKYWIYVVCFVLLMISIRRPVFVYNILYMAFFLVFISFVTMSFQFWKKMLFSYWVLLTAYSVFVLMIVYTFQFHNVPEIWYRWTNWPNETYYTRNLFIITIFQDFGLVTYTSGNLFLHLSRPISFLVVVILQMKFFHDTFLNVIINPDVACMSATDDSEQQQEDAWYNRFCRYLKIFVEHVWRILEVHFNKIIPLFIMYLAIDEVNAINLAFPVLSVLMLTFRKLYSCFCFASCVWAGVIVLAKMIFQLHISDISKIPIVFPHCSDDVISNQTVLENLFQWAGFEKTDNIAFYLVNYVVFFILLALQTIIYQRQQYTRAVNKVSEPEDGIIFENCTRNDADNGLLSCLKFLANYGCYKFGVELTYILITVSIAIRMDAFALFYGMMLFFLLMLQRRSLANVWYMVCACVGVSILLQYGICVGLPPNLCLNYPWNFDLKLIQWLYLPDFKHRPHVSFLITDVAVFFFSICQLYAFRIERKRAVKLLVSKRTNHPVIDDNEPASWSFVNASLNCSENELDGQRIPDFITKCSSALDVVKIVIFQYFHWLTLLAVLAAGVGGISAFTFGYLMAAFCFLWKGNDIFLTNPKGYLMQWKALVYFNVLAILMKVALQIPGCVYLSSICSFSPSVVQFLSIACIHSGFDLRSNHEETLLPDCKVSPDQAQIFYDTVCFAFLIFQLRIMNSWYFKHVVVEFKAEQVFSARGAMLIGQLIWKTMTKQQERENEVVEKVKRKTELIRANYLSHLKENEYYDPKTYNEAKRAGDYYMFEYDSALDMIDAQHTSKKSTPDESDDDGVGPLQLIHMAVTSDLPLGRIVDEVEEAGNLKKKLPDRKEEKPKVEGKTVDRCCLVGTSRYVKTLLVATLNRLIAYLNYLSHDYRYVAYVLRDEKVKLKSSLSDELSVMFEPDKLQQLINKTEIGQKIYRIPSERWLDKMQEKVENQWEGHGCLRRFLIALYYVIISHTDIVCYLMIILNQMFNASIISLPLPFFAFLWGTLCSPRPPKVFWVTLITYLESMIVIKFIFQFGFFPWNQLTTSNEPFYPPRIIGVEKKGDFAILDVILLMVLFFHRHQLKSLGLWRESMDNTINFDDVDKHGKEPTPEPIILPLDEPGNNGSYEMKEIFPKVESVDEQQQATIQQPCENPVTKNGFLDGILLYFDPIKRFYQQVINPPFRYITDLYAWMFLCDFICFLISAFSYTSFGVDTGRGDVVADIQSNKVPLPYVIILITLMVLMIIDRAIYLHKNVLKKLIFQYFLVFGTHIWIFFILPAITGRMSVKNKPAMLWYMVKGIYLLISSVQIRCGYSSQSLSNFLTKQYGLVNYVLFTCYRVVPFLFELRSLIDWIWTQTSMSLFDYITMENIFARIYTIRCSREIEKDYPQRKGEPRTVCNKYTYGLPVLVGLVAILWLPLLLFSTVNSIGMRLLPSNAKFQITIEGYPALYTSEAQGPFIRQLIPSEFDNLYLNYTSKHASTFLREYSPIDTVHTIFRVDSDTTWTISNPAKEALINQVKSSAELTLTIFFKYIRPAQSSSEPNAEHSFIRQMTLAANSQTRLALAEALTADSSTVVVVEKAFPSLVVVPALGNVHPAFSLVDLSASDSSAAYSDIYLRLHQVKQHPNNLMSPSGNDNDTSVNTDRPTSGVDLRTCWWQVTMNDPPIKWNQHQLLKQDVKVEQADDLNLNDTVDDSFEKAAEPITWSGINMIAFVDRVFPSALSYFTSRGIIGVYIVVVFAVARYVRTATMTPSMELTISEIPNVDPVLRLCMDVFLAREAKDFALEVDLFAKLLFLFRSPETLIRWTRHKVE